MMNENEKIEIEEGIDYLEEISKIKANTIDINTYNELQKDYKTLFSKYINGEKPENPKEKVDMNQLRKELYGGDQTMSNLDYWTKTMELREAIMESGKADPFVPQGKNIVATDEDKATAQRVAEGIQHCIDMAEGDNIVFTNELQRIMVDTAPIRRRK